MFFYAGFTASERGENRYFAPGDKMFPGAQEAGGWSSLAMPRRYIAAAAIANEGVRLGEG
jgi:hypothetical protein